MKKMKLLATAFAAAAFSVGGTNAAESTQIHYCLIRQAIKEDY